MAMVECPFLDISAMESTGPNMSKGDQMTPVLAGPGLASHPAIGTLICQSLIQGYPSPIEGPRLCDEG